MDQLYYATITLPINADADEEVVDMLVAGRLVKVLHKNANKRRYAIAFPDAGKGVVGREMRIFTKSSEDLQGLLSEKPVSRILRDYCLVTKVREVKRADGWVRLKRDRSVDRISPSRVRSIIRKQRNHPEGSLGHSVRELNAQNLPADAIASKLRLKTKRQFLWHESGSTGQTMRLYLKKEVSETPRGEFAPDAFGLNTWVPVF